MNAKRKLSIAKTVLFWFGVAFTLIVPLYVGIVLQDKNTAWITVLCGAFVTLMAKYDELAEVSFGPVKARMRETIRQANATIEQLQKVALSSAKATLTDLMAANFMAGTTLRTRLELHDNIISTLREIGLSAMEIKEANEQWQKGMGVIYHRVIRHNLEGRTKPQEINIKATPEVLEASARFQEMLDFEHWRAPSPDEMESFIEKRGLMTPDLKEWISDYRHYIQTGEVRRQELIEKQ